MIPTAEHDRPGHLVAGRPNELKRDFDMLALPLGELGEPPDQVLDHHDRPVDDQSEVDRPEAHQVAGETRPEHSGERPQHRQRQGQGDDDPGPPVAQQQQEHDHHQHAALQEDWC